MWDSATFLSALTPKFYVALTGTSSLISGLILIFEWWYYRKYGASFIEQVSLAHLGPWFAADEPAGAPPPMPQECKVWRNPMALLRGAEYARLWAAARRAPLTYYDMNLSAQEHQAWFGVPGADSPCEAALARAWREREPAARVAAARAALAARPDCAAALLLLAEEDAPTVAEAERVLKRAWRCAEAAWRVSSGAGVANVAGSAARARRDAAVLAHVKRRAGMCARRLGRLRDAARVFRELARDGPAPLHAHENLLEVLLEQRLYLDAQAVVARYDEPSLPASATILYTAALLRARAAALQPRPAAELQAIEAIRRAIEFNPHVPAYLLELRPLTLPPEHVLRRGDSEALAYAFCHLRHWRHCEGALKLLHLAHSTGPPAAAGAGAATACSLCLDRELLPPHHAAWRGGWAPRPRALLPLLGALCVLAALLALCAARWPHAAAALAPDRLLRLLHDV
ncbi:protein ST7 homolog [Leguminivora glycinivorella]|uniref:protein ST7 homolog n=1 Tax=Leguminivora glycinivorella TaxID=1035111 RepID=UPI00200D0A52|nr:protein ST7 homolog [Leguminivora glycinivorella]